MKWWDVEWGGVEVRRWVVEGWDVEWGVEFVDCGISGVEFGEDWWVNCGVFVVVYMEVGIFFEFFWWCDG